MSIRPMIVSMLLSLIWPAITYAIPIEFDVTVSPQSVFLPEGGISDEVRLAIGVKEDPISPPPGAGIVQQGSFSVIGEDSCCIRTLFSASIEDFATLGTFFLIFEDIRVPAGELNAFVEGFFGGSGTVFLSGFGGGQFTLVEPFIDTTPVPGPVTGRRPARPDLGRWGGLLAWWRRHRKIA
jgi:hypothetical protein